MFSQNTYVIGKLMKISTEEFTSQKNGKTYTKCSAFIKTPEGASMNVDKLIEMKTGISDYFVKAIALYEDLASRLVEKEEIYIQASVSPSDDGKMFDTISTYVNDAGKINLKMGGLVREVESDKNDEGKVVLKFKKSEKLWEDQTTSMVIQMIVKDIIDDEITFESYTDYPVELIAYLPEGIENKAIVGQGYKVEIKPVKGKKKEAKENLNWGEEAKPEYDSDFFEIKRVFGTVKGYVNKDTIQSNDANGMLY